MCNSICKFNVRLPNFIGYEPMKKIYMSIIVSYCKFQMILIELMLSEIQHYTESDWYIVTIIMFTVFSICRICQNLILKPFKYLQRVEGQWATQ